MTATLEAAARRPRSARSRRFDVTLKIRRYNPETAPAPRSRTGRSSRSAPHGTDRVLDALHKIKWEQDGSLTFRRSCAHGVCGSDAMRINGRNRLACKTLLKDLNPEQADHRRADQGPAGDQGPRRRHGAVLRVLPRGHAVPHHHRATSRPASACSRRADRERFDDTTKCILCAACTTSCPVFWTDGQYFGPAAIVNAHRFIFDSRDEGAEQRLEILNDKEGVWRCRTTFNCTEACPRGIEVTKAIQEVKRAMITRAF